MAKDKYSLFLEQSQFSSTILNHSALKSLDVNEKKKMWTFHISLDDVVEAETLLPFIQNIKSYFFVPRILSEIKVHLTYQNLNSFDKFAMSYFDYAIIQLSKDKASSIVLKNFKARYENKEFIISIDQDSTYLKQYIKDIQNILKKSSRI